MKVLADKIAIVTGGANGIGKATATLFAQAGATVIIWDMNEPKGKATEKELQEQGYKVHFAKVNTSEWKDVEAAADAVVKEYGQIDILLNNAGITRDATLAKMEVEQWEQVIDVNLSGVFYCGKAVAPYMIKKGYGRIINTSSVVALYGNFGQSNYAAAKAGLIGMSKVWARELGKKGITVNTVAPGFVQTDMMGTIPDKVMEGLLSRIPLARLGTPNEIGQVYLFLASDNASYINGATICADGG
ncbi:MAG TPA: beta-ketoacyl-ACP reductase, partial [Chitinophagales bacterium]|nr:beta-ketoacyl-ACP reductase [Chitinophagales bacterium]